MNRMKFPDEQIEQAILELARDFSLEIKDLVYTSNDKLDGILRDGGDSDWEWVLARSNSNVQISISVLYPSCLTFISLTNTDAELIGKVATNFSFNEYLSKYLKDYKDSSILNKIAVDRSWKDNWPMVLDLFKAHAQTDMHEIIEGKEWPNIEFNIEDYVDADAIERIKQDQTKLIENAKGKKGWLYLIDFKKKK